MRFYSKSFVTISIAAMAMVTVCASIHVHGSRREPVTKVRIEFVQTRGLHQQVTDTIKNYEELLAYPPKPEPATARERLVAITSVVKKLDTSDIKIEGAVVDLTNQVLVSIADYKAIDGKISEAQSASDGKKKEVDESQTRLDGVTDTASESYKSQKIAHDKLVADKTKLDGNLDSFKKQKEDGKIGNEQLTKDLASLQQNFFTKKLEATASAENCVLHLRTKKVIDDIKSLLTEQAKFAKAIGTYPATPNYELASNSDVADYLRTASVNLDEYVSPLTFIMDLRSFEQFAFNGDRSVATVYKELTDAVKESIKSITASYVASECLANKYLPVQTEAIKGRLKVAKNSEVVDLTVVNREGRTLDACVSSLNKSFVEAVKCATPNFSYALPSSLEAFQNQLISLEDWLEGASDDTIVDQVRLFYYPNPMAIANSLRPREDFILLNPNSISADKVASQKKNELRKLEADIFVTSAERNELQSRLLTLRDTITKLNKETANKDKEIARYTSRLASNSDEDKKISDQIKGIDGKLTSSTEAQKAELNKQKKLLTDRQEALAKSTSETTKKKTAAEIEKTKLDNQATALTTEKDDAPSKIENAESALLEKSKALNVIRLGMPGLASDEAEAFGGYVQNEPIYLAPGFRDAGSAARGVRLVIFPRSKVIVLRGPKRNVTMVKDMIALFDRPTPQARITLHTLQVNGQDPQAMANAMANITGALRDAKASMGIVQDTLRNAITAEVGRCERASRLYDSHQKTGPSVGVVDRSRDYGGYHRAQVYSAEVQATLGVSGLDRDAWRINRTLVELEELSALIADAATELKSAQQYFKGSKTEDRNVQAANQKAAKFAFARFRLVATRAAYLATVVQRRANSDQVIAAYLDNFFNVKPEGKAFKRVFSEAYEVVRGHHDDPDSVCDELVRAYNCDANFQKCSDKECKCAGVGRKGTKCTCKSSDCPCKHVEPKLHTVPDGDIEVLTMRLHNSIQSLYTYLISGTEVKKVSNCRSNRYLCSLTVPDPAKVTTLGEMLFVMSLVSKDSRERILHDFAEQLYYDAKLNHDIAGVKDPANEANKQIFDFAVATIRQFGNQAHNEPEFADAKKFAPYPLFPRSVFGANPFSGAGADSSWMQGGVLVGSGILANDEVSSNQLEILYGLRAKIRRNLASELRRTAYYIGNKIRGKAEPIPSEELEIIKFAKGLVHYRADMTSVAEPGPDDATRLNRLADRLEESESLSTATPRVAAADQMIKRFMETFETDFDKFFVEPMLTRVRAATSVRGISFGGYERKSILASNRLLARVEVTGSANVQVGDEQNVVGESAALLSILKSLAPTQKPTVDESSNNSAAKALIDGAATSAVMKNNKLGFGTFGALLSSLLDMPKEDRGEIYSIGTGGSFKVNPIFNPSGQGITFRLDYAQATNIQEPNGTTQLQSARIDRHTVNTEVQISNLDISEISSFENNYMLGRAEKTSGGLPILRDIFPTVPLIGWFTRSPRINPVRQSSLIFAQTAMYPTVGDIMDLLVENPTGGQFRTSGASDFNRPKDSDGGK